MKTLLSAVAVTLVLLGQAPAVAAGKAATLKPNAENETGPVGIGPLKLGMSKAEVEALTHGDVYLAARMHRTFNRNSDQDPGVERYVSKLVTPLSSSPIDLSLAFKDGVLNAISVFARGRSSVVSTLVAQVVAKFGEGSFSNSTYEIPCGFLNGEKLSAQNGDVTQAWTTKSGDNKTIQTTFTRARMDICSARWHGDSVIGVTLEHLTFKSL
ncbi:hypothetical protein COAQ111491_22015 [Comamonas aquatilis]|uniref:hypothetical protein n=1 Tax=Comamonas aquatilis TaxID=1778406 RepID=UPI0039F01C92